MIVIIGEILFDIFGKDKRLGGAPFNFAYHLKHFGYPVRFISRVGDDALGQEILTELSAAEFNLADIQIDAVHKTGTVDVRLDDANSPQFNILPDVAYDYIQFDPDTHGGLLSRAKMIYFGSLAQRGASGFQNIQAMVSRKRGGTRCFYDINLRPKGYNKAVVDQSLTHTDVLKINDTEWDAIKEMLEFKDGDHDFKDFLMGHYSLDAIALTRGEAGSVLMTRDDTFGAETIKPKKMVDSVGAGDAYAAMLVAGLLQQWPPKILLQRASSFAARICEIRGAIPDSRTFYEPFQAMIQNGGKYAD